MDQSDAFHFGFKPRAGLPELDPEHPEVWENALFGGGVGNTFTVWGTPLPCPVEVTLGRDKSGRLTITVLRIDAEKHGATINATTLRKVGVALTELLRRIAEHQMEDSESWATFLGPLLSGAAEPYAGVVIRPGRRGHSDEFYREVAEGWAVAVREDPQHPYSLLARRLWRSESQARRLVKRARELHPELFTEVDG
jgi:hypothetical protein